VESSLSKETMIMIVKALTLIQAASLMTMNRLPTLISLKRKRFRRSILIIFDQLSIFFSR